MIFELFSELFLILVLSTYKFRINCIDYYYNYYYVNIKDLY